jgi:kynurenine formamidase
MMTKRYLLPASLIIALMLTGADKYPHELTKTDIEHWMIEISNWGRWGRADQDGTLNLITPEKRREAAALVRAGIAVSLSVDVMPAAAWTHGTRLLNADQPVGYVLDNIGVSYHGNFTTHLDALNHMFYHGQMYNGISISTVTESGAPKDDVMRYKNGIVTRGILVDIPVLKSKAFLDDDEPVYPEDLIAWEKRAGIKIGSGDAVFVRTGRWMRVAARGPLDLSHIAPGLHASSARWLHDRDIALLGSDAVSDVRPSRVEGVDQPVHQLMLVALGTPLLDNCALDAVAELAGKLKRWEFMLTVAPLAVPGGTGSPVNPIATF